MASTTWICFGLVCLGCVIICCNALINYQWSWNSIGIGLVVIICCNVLIMVQPWPRQRFLSDPRLWPFHAQADTLQLNKCWHHHCHHHQHIILPFPHHDRIQYTSSYRYGIRITDTYILSLKKIISCNTNGWCTQSLSTLYCTSVNHCRMETF